ncbi:MAG: hypothetical protein LQ345_005743 [Seirophora villosa]|nr:MAG: hypothetical protein LQ345_005743 [Seirophora villosa]
MSTSGGDSPRPFEASHSQADMTWLDSQQDKLEMQPDEAAENPILSNVVDQAQIMEIISAASDSSSTLQAREEKSLGPEFPPNDRKDVDFTGLDHDALSVKQEPLKPEFGPVNRIDIDLTGFDDDTPMIKQEFGPVHHIDIDLTGSEDDTPKSFKEEDVGNNVHWKEILPGYIELSDFEEADHVGISDPEEDDHGTPVANYSLISASGHDPTTLQRPAQDKLIDDIVLSNQRADIPAPSRTKVDQGSSILQTSNSRSKKSAADVPRIKKLQAFYAARALSRDRAERDLGTRINLPGSGMAHTIEDDVEEDSLFLPQGNKSAPEKRRHTEIIETEGSDQEVQEIEGSVVPDTRGKPKPKRKPKLMPKSGEELQKIQLSEMRASLAIGLNNSTPNGRPDIWRGRPTKSTKKAPNSEPKRPVKKSKKTKDRCTDLDELMKGIQSHDVLAEANANVGQEALPTSLETTKQAYLKAILHSIPEGDRPGVRGEKKRLDKAASVFPQGSVRAAEGGWRLKGLKSVLMHHQLLGASFMRERELGMGQPFGGLLADEMGFGKTGVFNRIIVHHATSQLQGEGVERVLAEADVVLTTYGQVVKSWPLGHPPENLETAEERRLWWEKHWGDQKGVLHRAYFHRVVLDEAQAIKNHKAHVSLACQSLMANYRWAISGTPIMNRIEEFYPYFKFLRAPFAGNFEDFRLNFCGKGDRIYTDRLHACLNQFMLRRTHVDLIFGRPIIKLPKCYSETTTLRPTKVEMSIYRAVEFRYAQAVNAISRWGSEEQIRRVTMAMVTRLRQITAHLFLVQQIMQDMFELDDVEKLWNLVTPNSPDHDTPNHDTANHDTLVAIQALIANKEDDEEPDEQPEDQKYHAEQYTAPSAALLSKFQDYLRTLISTSDAAEFSKRSTCPRCESPPENAYVTSCMHVYCHECLLAMATIAAASDERTKCLVCESVYNGSEPCGGMKELNHEIGTGLAANGNAAKKKRHKPPKDLLKWIRRREGVLPSTKSAGVVDQIDRWLTEEPEKKIIVFSQWRMISSSRTVESKDGVTALQYHGGMTNKQREKSIAQFADEPDKLILVASLKCGGLGLNLTMASKIICVDLWFNSFVEQQAFCRIFRIGQESETYVKRFVLAGSVDERLVALQERKKKLIGRALGDTEGFKHFSTEDLMRLFGTVQRDENDRPFIVVDDKGDDFQVGSSAAE